MVSNYILVIRWNAVETVRFNKIFTPENWVKLRYFMQSVSPTNSF